MQYILLNEVDLNRLSIEWSFNRLFGISRLNAKQMTHLPNPPLLF